MIRQWISKSCNMPFSSIFHSGLSFVYQMEDNNLPIFRLYSDGHIEVSGLNLAALSDYKEVPQDELYYQNNYDKEVSFIKDNNLISIKKLCSCSFEDVMNYGCKCGGI